MVFIDKICRDHGLRYSLSYGTLIGAIRHKGFIPWDDDIDIVMPRPDHDKLIQIIKNMNSPDFGIMDSYDLDSFYTTRILKVYSKKTCLKEFPHKYHLEYGAFVDVFAVNGMPNDIRTIKKCSNPSLYAVECYTCIFHLFIALKVNEKNSNGYSNHSPELPCAKRMKFSINILLIRLNTL